MTRKPKTTAAAAGTPTANDLEILKTIARQLLAEGWAVALLGHSYTREARAAAAKIPMRLNAAERQELYLAIIPAEAHAFRSGQLVAPLGLGLRGDGARVAQLLSAAGLAAHWTGDEGDGAIILLPRATSQIGAPADQAISNLRAIVALTDDPHVEEIARATADLLSGDILAGAAPAAAAVPPAIVNPLERSSAEQLADLLAEDADAPAHEGDSPWDRYVQQKQAEAAAAGAIDPNRTGKRRAERDGPAEFRNQPAPKRAGRPKKAAAAAAQESEVAPGTEPATPEAPEATAEPRRRGRPKRAAAEATPPAV